MSVRVAFVEKQEAGQDYCGPVHKIWIGQLSQDTGVPHYEISDKVWAKYNGVCCLIDGHYAHSNEKTFAAMKKALEVVPGVGVEEIVFPAEKRQRATDTLRHDVHQLLIVGDVAESLMVLKLSRKAPVIPLILEHAIESALEITRHPNEAIRNFAPLQFSPKPAEAVL